MGHLKRKTIMTTILAVFAAYVLVIGFSAGAYADKSGEKNVLIEQLPTKLSDSEEPYSKFSKDNLSSHNLLVEVKWKGDYYETKDWVEWSQFKKGIYKKTNSATPTLDYVLKYVKKEKWDYTFTLYDKSIQDYPDEWISVTEATVSLTDEVATLDRIDAIDSLTINKVVTKVDFKKKGYATVLFGAILAFLQENAPIVNHLTALDASESDGHATKSMFKHYRGLGHSFNNLDISIKAINKDNLPTLNKKQLNDIPNADHELSFVEDDC